MHIKVKYLLISCTIEYLIVLITASCPSSWTPWKHKCLILHTDQEGISFYEAINLCSDIYNGYMLVINSDEEQEFIEEFAFDQHESEFHIWLGAFKSQINDIEQFKWLDGSPFNYTSWSPDKRNDTDINNYCLVMESGESGKWIDYSCTNWCYTICQRNADEFENDTNIAKTHHLNHNKKVDIKQNNMLDMSTLSPKVLNESLNLIKSNDSLSNNNLGKQLKQIGSNKGAITVAIVMVIITTIMVYIIILMCVKLRKSGMSYYSWFGSL